MEPKRRTTEAPPKEILHHWDLTMLALGRQCPVLLEVLAVAMRQRGGLAAHGGALRWNFASLSQVLEEPSERLGAGLVHARHATLLPPELRE